MNRTRVVETCSASALAWAAVLCLTQCAIAQPADNGIVVGQAKLYDERSLESMLSSVKSGLGGTNFINQSAVAQNEGVLQGGDLTSSSVSASINQVGKGSPTAAATTTTTAPTSTVTVPAGSSPSFTATGIGVTAPLAVSSQDMLQQQIGLSFEATNLELLLEHSLSDRLIFKEGADSATPRALAVLGFQVTVDPRNEDKYSVAEAEITVTSPNGVARPEVAMMLPQDKTYNVAKVTSDSHTIGLGAFAQPFDGGLHVGTSRNSAYVVYDVDTVALQCPVGSDSKSVTFAWQFRPVLGAKAVQPGTRQVYVLLSLPVTSEEDYTPQITVRTYWKRLDTKSSTVEDKEIAGQSSVYSLDSLPIHKVNDYDDGLRPVIYNIQSHDAGNGQVYVEAEGGNFTNNMSVVMDGRPVSVYEQGGRLLAFTAPIAALSYANPIVVGNYGLPVDLVQPTLHDNTGAAIAPTQDGEGLTIKDVKVVPLDANNSVVKIQVVARNTVSTHPLLPANGQLTITIGSQVYGLNDNPVGLEPASSPYTTFDVRVPNSVLQTAQKVTVRYLFCGDDYRSDFALPGAAFSVDSVTVVSKDKQSVVLALKGNFHQSLTAYVYSGASPVEFDPTVPVAGSFLLLQAKPSAGVSVRSRGAGATGPSRGENPFFEPSVAPSIPDPSYNLALLTAQQSQLKGADYIVLYEKGSPAQLLSVADCLKCLNPPIGAVKGNATIPMTPSQWEMWGTWNPSSKVTATQSGSGGLSTSTSTTEPAIGSQSTNSGQQNLPIILQMGTQTTSPSQQPPTSTKK